MSVLTRVPNEEEERLLRLEALEKQFATDIARLFKRIPQGPDAFGAFQVAPERVDDVFEPPFDLTGSVAFSGGTGAAGSASATGQGSGGSGGGSGPGLTGGTPNVSGGTLQTGGQQQTGATVGTGFTGGTFTGQGSGGTGLPGPGGTGTPESGINTGRSGGGSGPGLTGGTQTRGTDHSGTQVSGNCYGPLFNDTFTGTGGLQLAFHTPDLDKLAGGWQGDVLQLELSGGGLVQPRNAAGTGTNEYRAFANVGEKNVWLYALGTSLGNANGGSNRYAGFVVRYVSDLDHWILRVNVTSGVIEIIEVNGGTRTTRASYPIDPGVYGTNPVMEAIVRDRYILFKFGAYQVSYGSASYLEGAGRHGIYFGHVGTVNSNQQISSLAINCVPADESGTGRSGSKSESHLSGGGASGGSGLTGGTGMTAGTTNTGGTPVGSGGTYLEYVSIPTGDVTTSWNTTTPHWSRLDDTSTWVGTPLTGALDRVTADGNDDNEEEVYSMSVSLPGGATVKRMTASIFASSDTAAITVERRIKINGTFQTAFSGNVGTGGGSWLSSTALTGTWTGAGLTLEIGIKPLVIAKSNSFRLDAVQIKLEYWT